MPQEPVVALEIGTSKVRALVGEEREDGYLMITGVGECPSRGVRKGEITDFDTALVCVEHVLRMAEDASKVSINQLHVVVSGGHIQGTRNAGTIPILPADSEITREDIERVMENARAISLPPERDVLHSIHQQFIVDDQPGVLNPEGLAGARLMVSMLILHGVRNRISNVLRVASSARVDTVGCAFGGLCTALAVLTPEQKENGCVVIDLGGGTTDYVVYAHRAIALAGSLGVGGDHVTNDLAQVLSIPTAAAEKLKMDHGLTPPGRAPVDQTLTIPASGGFAGRSARLMDVQAIINTRMEETLGMIRHEMDQYQLQKVMGGGVILTGGGAYMKNILPFTESFMNMPSAIGHPRNVSGIAHATEGPEYAATVGMLRYGLRSAAENNAPAAGLFKKLGQWFGR